jgi:diguanylate cyclase (GGDEF)-like protein
MPLSISVNALLGPALVLIILFMDYAVKIEVDNFRRKIYLFLVITTFLAVVSNFVNIFLAGKSGPAVHAILLTANYVYFVFQNTSYYFIVVFMDYLANKDNARTRKFIYLVCAIMGVHLLFIFLNIPFGFYFSISDSNELIRGNLYMVRFLTGYAAILLAIGDLFVSSKFFDKAALYPVVFFAVLIGGGAALDFILHYDGIIWPCFCAALLYGYFYIGRIDTKLDSVTGLGNRLSFNEYINQLIRMPGKQSVHMCLFDINGLKKINDEYGVEAGDKALSDMALILKKCARQYDFVARFGGDEFIVVIKAKFDIEKLISRILKNIDEQNQNKDRSYTLSISYGYDKFTTREGEPMDEFLNRLNELVFRHKSAQRAEANTAGRR